ncbi:MAG: hypothetical protein ACK44D_01460 [Bacteroidia bacterium]
MQQFILHAITNFNTMFQHMESAARNNLSRGIISYAIVTCFTKHIAILVITGYMLQE